MKNMGEAKKKNNNKISPEDNAIINSNIIEIFKI